MTAYTVEGPHKVDGWYYSAEARGIVGGEHDVWHILAPDGQLAAICAMELAALKTADFLNSLEYEEALAVVNGFLRTGIAYAKQG